MEVGMHLHTLTFADMPAVGWHIPSLSIWHAHILNAL